jgi:hypothetical protein
MAKIDSYLPEEVAAEFETVNWPGADKWRLVFPSFSNIVANGTVNIKLLTVKSAGALVVAGFPYLRRKPAKELPETPKPAKAGK